MTALVQHSNESSKVEISLDLGCLDYALNLFPFSSRRMYMFNLIDACRDTEERSITRPDPDED